MFVEVEAGSILKTNHENKVKQTQIDIETLRNSLPSGPGPEWKGKAEIVGVPSMLYVQPPSKTGNSVKFGKRMVSKPPEKRNMQNSTAWPKLAWSLSRAPCPNAADDGMQIQPVRSRCTIERAAQPYIQSTLRFLLVAKTGSKTTKRGQHVSPFKP